MTALADEMERTGRRGDALRPAVKAQVTSAEQSLLKWERAELPPHYGDALKRDADEWQRRLDQIDAALRVKGGA